MKRIIFTLIMALSATAMWAQSGVILSYTENGVQKEQAFRLDSVSSWGYNPSDKTVFVQPLVGAKFSIPSQNFLSFIYSPIVPDDAGVSDYIVVNVDGQKAAFLIEEDLEMTWIGGVLAIKDKKQSQTIGLKDGIFFTVESLSFGYTNSNISPIPATGNWYMVLFSDRYSCGSNYYFTTYYNEIIGRLSLTIINTDNDAYYFRFPASPDGVEDLYISSKVIGKLHDEKP